MKPLGQKHYNDKSGGKHSSKSNGKTEAWWEEDAIPTSNKALYKRGCKDMINGELDDIDYVEEDETLCLY